MIGGFFQEVFHKREAYFKLMRLHNLTGAWLLMWPCLWTVILSARSFGDLIWLPFFVIGSVVMRSLGCVVNDLLDRDIDADVHRTKDRPLASGSLKPRGAIKFIILLSCMGLGLLLFLGGEALVLGMVLAILIFVYPFAKRFLYYPQFLLAIIYSSGSLFSALAVTSTLDSSVIIMYLGCCLWVLFYDTVYAHQDKEYDKQLGLKSTALSRFGNRIWLDSFLNTAMLLWGIAGSLAGEGLLFYLSLITSFVFIRKKFAKVAFDDPGVCMQFFHYNNKIGWMVFISLILGKFQVLTL